MKKIESIFRIEFEDEMVLQAAFNLVFSILLGCRDLDTDGK